jgi:hypothetical protein
MLKIRHLEAGIAQLVEHDLAKVGVASSSLVSRSNIQNPAWSQSAAGFFIVPGPWPAFLRIYTWHCDSADSRITRFRANARRLFTEARWQSGHAAACKAVYAGSIPTLASN